MQEESDFSIFDCGISTSQKQDAPAGRSPRDRRKVRKVFFFFFIFYHTEAYVNVANVKMLTIAKSNVANDADFFPIGKWQHRKWQQWQHWQHSTTNSVSRGCLRTLLVRLRRICPPKQSFCGAFRLCVGKKKTGDEKNLHEISA